MEPSNEPRDPGAAKLAAIDEILQVMYWLRGERLADAVSAGDLVRWAGKQPDEIAALLASMADSGLVQRVEGGAAEAVRYALTSVGAREGGRRFADEFAGLTRAGHGECSDPHCECQRTGDPADCVHRNT
jgi:hypothetical protein